MTTIRKCPACGKTSIMIDSGNINGLHIVQIHCMCGWPHDKAKLFNTKSKALAAHNKLAIKAARKGGAA